MRFSLFCLNIEDCRNQLKLKKFRSMDQTEWYSYDWSLDVKPLYKPDVPAFARLFIIKRLLSNLTNNHITVNDAVALLLKHLNNEDEQNAAATILHAVVKNDIYSYIDKTYNDDNDPLIIDKIFRQVILEHYEKEYTQIITFPSINDDTKEHNNSSMILLFNTKDLMCLIFQFLNMYDNVQCGLVCSHLFYYSFDTQSNIYQTFKFQFGKYDFNLEDKLKSRRQAAHVWKCRLHRFYKTKSVIFGVRLGEYPFELTYTALQVLATFEHIEKLVINSNIVDLKVIQVLVESCGDKIQTFYLSIDHTQCILTTSKDLPVLKLPNVERIWLDGICLPIIFSNKLKYLTLANLPRKENKITPQWCDFVIKHCDCSNIISFYAYDAQVQGNWDITSININTDTAVDDSKHNDYDIHNSSDEDKNDYNYQCDKIEAAMNFGQQFTGLKKLDIIFDCLTLPYLTLSRLFWKSFISGLKQDAAINGNINNIIVKNNTIMSLNIDPHETHLSSNFPWRRNYNYRKKQPQMEIDYIKNNPYPYKYSVEEIDLSKVAKYSSKTKSQLTRQGLFEGIFTVQGECLNKTPYKGCVLKIKIHFESRRNNPPLVTLETPIYHINFYRHGKVYEISKLDALHESWNKDRSLKQILDAIVDLIRFPNPRSPGGIHRGTFLEKLILYLDDRDEYNRIAARETQKLINET